MKTGMEWGLGGLVILLIAVVGWNAFNDARLEMSVASLNAAAAGEQLPGPALLAGEWVVKAVVGTLIGGVVTTVIGLLIAWGRRQWRAQEQIQRRGQWQSGPNANWGRQPKLPSEAELYRLMLLQQMSQQPGGRSTLPRIMQEGDDEPTFTL